MNAYQHLPHKDFVSIERKLDAYLVEVDGQVVTVGRRYQRILHH